jgi:alpha-N-arabinofuranosidase
MPRSWAQPLSTNVYSQFIEHLGRCIYGGIWAEMLEDRKFYHPITANYPLPLAQNTPYPVVGASPWKITSETPPGVTMRPPTSRSSAVTRRASAAGSGTAPTRPRRVTAGKVRRLRLAQGPARSRAHEVTLTWGDDQGYARRARQRRTSLAANYYSAPSSSPRTNTSDKAWVELRVDPAPSSSARPP